MKKSVTRKELILSLVAIPCIFLPRRWEVLGVFSYRCFIILSFLVGTLTFHKKAKLSYFKKTPLYVLMILVFGINYLINGEIVSLIGYLVDNVIFIIILTTFINYKQDIDFFCCLFCKTMIIYCSLCVIEMITGFNIWSLFTTIKYTDFLRFGLHRAYGSFTTSINNGNFLFLTFPISFYVLNYTKMKKLGKMTVILTWIALFATLSRAPILAAIILNVILAWKNGILKFIKNNWHKILAIVYLIITMFLLPVTRNVLSNFASMFIAIFDSNVANNISSSFGANAAGVGHRINLYSWVWNSLNNIWIGNGANSYFNYDFVTTQGSIHTKQSIENYYLATLYKFGIIGLTSISLFFLDTINKYKTMVKISHDSFIKYSYATTIIYFLVLFTVSAVDEYRMFLILIILSTVLFNFHKQSLVFIPESERKG